MEERWRERRQREDRRMWKEMEEFINRKRNERNENRELILESEEMVFRRSTMTNKSPLKERRNVGTARG